MNIDKKELKKIIEEVDKVIEEAPTTKADEKVLTLIGGFLDNAPQCADDPRLMWFCVVGWALHVFDDNYDAFEECTKKHREIKKMIEKHPGVHVVCTNLNDLLKKEDEEDGGYQA